MLFVPENWNCLWHLLRALMHFYWCSASFLSSVCSAWVYILGYYRAVVVVFSPLLPGTLAACHLFVRSLRGTPSGGLLLCAVCITCVHGFRVTWMREQPLLFLHATHALGSGKSLVSCPWVCCCSCVLFLCLAYTQPVRATSMLPVPAAPCANIFTHPNICGS